MAERFFTTGNEEYDAASWLSTLQLMERLGDRLKDQSSAPARLCGMVLHKPSEFLDEFGYYASATGDTQTAEKRFLVEMGAVSRGDRIVRGLSHAALLFSDDPISQEIKEGSSFARLIPLIKEVSNYCDKKFLKDVSHAELTRVSYPTRLSYARAEADLYIRQYDGEPETVAISPLYL